ncbi:hypothetical protein ES319_D08G183300v1, partial [Gossypium barbadense]
QPYYTSTNRQHRGSNTTLRNQQHENYVINDSLSLSGSELREINGWDNKYSSCSCFRYPYNHVEVIGRSLNLIQSRLVKGF